jgi:hypothetical protein
MCFTLFDVDLTFMFLVLCLFQTTTGLKGTRKLQSFQGITLAASEGQSDSNSAIFSGGVPGGTGASFGNGNAVGTSNGFIYSSGGQAQSSGASGGNSTAKTDLTVLSLNDGAATSGGGLSDGTLSSAGTGGGSAGGNAVFTLAAAIAAATPCRNTGTQVATEVQETTSQEETTMSMLPSPPLPLRFPFSGSTLAFRPVER